MNGDGIVTMSDISLLRSGFERCGDISADNDFQAMTADGAPTLAQALDPGKIPLRRNTTLHLACPATAISRQVTLSRSMYSRRRVANPLTEHHSSCDMMRTASWPSMLRGTRLRV